MGRRRKSGRPISGWVLVDKPAGPTSTDIVNKTRWAFNAQKAGHAGTLDPDATGLLAVALGEATKTIPYVTDALKCYHFEMAFGAATSTDDASGEIIATSDAIPNEDDIIPQLSQFVGQIEQIPPQVSAVKVDGNRAYDLAREGETMELAPRPLWVEELSLEAWEPPKAELIFTCGKGGYVRSIARDLGQALGTHAHVTWLRRLWSGPFDVDDAITLDEIERLARTDDIDALLKPVELGLAELPRLTVTELAAAKLRNGNPAEAVGSAEFGDTVWAAHQGKAVAIGIYRAGQLHPSRVILP